METKDEVVIDRQSHHFDVPVAVEATHEECLAGRIPFPDDLDRSNWVLSDLYVNVMDEEKPTGQYLVRIGPDDGNLQFAEHAAGGVPVSSDLVEALVDYAYFLLRHVFSVLDAGEHLVDFRSRFLGTSVWSLAMLRDQPFV